MKINTIRTFRILGLLAYATCLNAGFSFEMLVRLNTGYIPLGEIALRDIAACQYKEDEYAYNSVIYKHSCVMDSYVQIVLDNDEIINATFDQLLCSKDKIFLKAIDLQAGQILHARSGDVVIRDIIHKKEKKEFFDITIADAHTFYVSRSEVLVHNFEPIMTLGFLASVTIPQIASWVGVTVLGALLAKKMCGKQPVVEVRVDQDSEMEQPDKPCWCGCGICGGGCGCQCGCICSKRKKDEKSSEEYTYEHGKYENAGYHHMNSKGPSSNGKSPAPMDGQRVLDGSIKVEGESNRRVGVTAQGEFVVLDRTLKGLTPSQDIFHGHIRTWKEICADPKGHIMRTIIKNGIANLAGKILKSL